MQVSSHSLEYNFNENNIFQYTTKRDNKKEINTVKRNLTAQCVASIRKYESTLLRMIT